MSAEVLRENRRSSRHAWIRIGQAGGEADWGTLFRVARNLPPSSAPPSEMASFPPDRLAGDFGPDDGGYLAKETSIIATDDAFRYRHHDYRLLSAFHRQLGRRVLHLGCNVGVNSVILARNGLQVHGVDLQAEAIRRAVARRDLEDDAVRARLTFQCATFASMRVPCGSFDSVIAFDVLEHIYLDDLDGLLDTIISALRPGGHLLVHMPRLDSFADPAHVTTWDVDSARQRLSTRFRVLRCFVTEENDVVPGSQRVNLLARAGSDAGTTSRDRAVGAPAGQTASFVSRHFTDTYSPARAQQCLSALTVAAEVRAPFSAIRLGDMEVAFLRYGRGPGADAGRLPGAHIAEHIGIDPERLPVRDRERLQDEFFDCCMSADILGTHRHTVNTSWSAHATEMFTWWGVHDRYLPREVDVVFFAELLDQGFMLPLLSRGRILLVGNAAPAFAALLRDPAYRSRFAHVGMPHAEPDVVGSIFVPHEGTAACDGLDHLWEQIRTHTFDTAFIAASAVGKILAGRIKRHLGAMALDIGWNMQFLAGVSSPVAPATDMTYARRRRGYEQLFQGRTTALEGT